MNTTIGIVMAISWISFSSHNCSFFQEVKVIRYCEIHWYTT
jgi:hypothetical protein